MTGGWAATNTLRVNAQHFLEGVGALIPGAKVEHSEDCPGCKQEAALALVEAALDAAETFMDSAGVVLPSTGSRQTTVMALVEEWQEARGLSNALAAALRAVREGK